MTRANSYRRGYSARWYEVRALFLREHPLCRYCAALGRTVSAEVVDHIRPHRGDYATFWDPTNWQPLCKRCHDSVKQRVEHGRTLPGCGPDGLPIDPAHPWNNAAPVASQAVQ